MPDPSHLADFFNMFFYFSIAHFDLPICLRVVGCDDAMMYSIVLKKYTKLSIIEM